MELQEKYMITMDPKVLQEIESIESEMIDAPQNFDLKDPNNIITKLDLNFQSECASLERSGVENPKKLSVFEFNAKRDYFDSLAKKK